MTKTAQLLGMDVGTGGGSVSLSAPITITVQGNADARQLLKSSEPRAMCSMSWSGNYKN